MRDTGDSKVGSKGIITNIQRNSIHDGPGIRTTVFFKGCTLRCFWCHNPETINPKQELQVFDGKCIGCGLCLSACPTGARLLEDGRLSLNRKACLACGKCADVCASKALVLCGMEMEVEEILREVCKDKAFYDASGGGVTFSGGEPLLQKDFLKSLLVSCKRSGLHTAVETAGNVPWEYFMEILPDVDLFLYDIKQMDRSIHRSAVGSDNALLLDNIARLSESGAEIWVRVPVIPSVNATVADMEKIAAFLKDKRGVTGVELLPFHMLARFKYESLGLECRSADLKSPSPELMQELNSVFNISDK